MKTAFKIVAVLFLLLDSFPVSIAHAEYSFTPQIKITDTSATHMFTPPSGQHSLVVRGNNVFLVWSAGSYDQNGLLTSMIFFAKSTDRGQSFSRPIPILPDWNTTYGPGLYLAPMLAVNESGEHIHVTWTSYYEGGIWYSKSSDGGASFSLPRNIGGGGWHPSIAIFNQEIYITYVYEAGDWRDFFIVKSADGGATFSTPIRLPINIENIEYSFSRTPVIEVDSLGNLYVVWAGWFYGTGDSTYSRLVMAKSVDQGLTFGPIWASEPNANISEYQYLSVDSPTFKINDGMVYLAWQEYRDSHWNVYFSKSIRNDEILTFGSALRVNDEVSNSINPNLDIDAAGNIYTVWEDGRNGNSDIYFAKSTTNVGSSFDSNELVAGGANAQSTPECAVNESGNPYITWIDTRPDDTYFPPFASDIYFTKGTLRDTIPPETSLFSGPTGWVNINSATFVFAGEDNLTPATQLSYSYKLDDGEWSGYSSAIEVTLLGLSEGLHTFYVKARDLADNEDPTPATQSFSVDTTPPSLDVHTSPNIIWPPNQRMVDININGLATDAGSGISGLSIRIIDEYGGELSLSEFGTVQLEAWREGNDLDGRHYNVVVTAADNVGNFVTEQSLVLVPHDQRR